ncbi:MAG: Lanthionine biosynthesis cyclase LanC [Firmicutes bacterium]|nr:Lanthionine biosynthesis cyclase LanC [Bacillota bacterium]
MHWQPMMQGALRDRAMATAWEIADGLAPGAEPSLAAGSAGLAVLYAYLAGERADAGYREMAVACLSRAARTISGQPVSPALFRGVTGVAWAAAHLGIHSEMAAVEDLFEAADRALLAGVSHAPWNGAYGLVDGLVGYGVYALERLPRAAAALGLKKLVDRLSALAHWDSRGATWLTRAEMLPDRLRTLAPQGCYDLGVARGVPGVIAMLGCVIQVGVAVPKARSLLDGAVSWLLSQQLGADSPSTFPAWAAPDAARTPARTGWCHGDPGVAAALLMAARAVGEPAWEREALVIARRAAMRPPAKSGVTDAAFCHGSAGLAHLFNRLYQATGDAELQLAARFWVEQTLALRRPEAPLMGYPCEGGLLRGAPGVALSLLAACTPAEPAWDRMFLLSPT